MLERAILSSSSWEYIFKHMANIKVLVVEDEKYARDKLCRFLGMLGVELDVFEAADGGEGAELLERLSPQVLIADIHMPRVNGFSMITRLPKEDRPLIIFTTAYEEHAVRAFEVEAIDYLLKPFSFERFLIAMQRVIKRLNLIQMIDEDVEADPVEENQSSFLSHVRVEGHQRAQIILSLSVVKVIKAAGNYIEFFTDEESYLRRGTLKELITRLQPREFLRINRSVIIRVDAIQEVNVDRHGDANVLMENGEVLKWSRRYRAENGGSFEV